MSEEPKGILKVLPKAKVQSNDPEPKPEIIAMMEHLLAKAKSGELSGVLVISHSVGQYGHDFAGLDSMSDLLGFNTMCDLVKDHLLGVIANNAG